MNKNLTTLHDAIQDDGGPEITRANLIQALHILCVPHALEAVTLICHHFVEMVDDHPEFMNHPIPDLQARLAILRRISELKNLPIEFTRSSQADTSKTPLYGNTGDGPACDGLLILPEDESDEQAFEHLIVWFVWQSVRHNHIKIPSQTYVSYLDTEELGSRLVNKKEGGRLASAFRAVRALGVASNSDSLRRVLELDLALDEQASRELSTLCRIAQLKKIPDGFADKWSEDLELEEQDFRNRIDIAKHEIDASLRILLTGLWEPLFDPKRTGVGTRPGRIRRESKSLSLRRYGGQVVVSEPIVVGGVHSGVVSDIHLPDRPEKSGQCDDEPDLPNEPALSLFIGERKNFIGASYAARGLRAVIEYDAAKLPYARSRLSRQAIARVIELTVPAPGDDKALVGGRLLLALSLISGRSLAAVKSFVIVSGENASSQVAALIQSSEVDKNASLTINAEDMTQTVHAGEPHLKKPITDGLNKYLNPHRHYLQLHIPEPLHALIATCVDREIFDGRKRESYVTNARRLVRGEPSHIGISEKGIREALHRNLLLAKGGDLGLVKVITDDQSLNGNNIIHYASYMTRDAEQEWYLGVHTIFCTNPDPHDFKPSAWAGDTHVGSPYRFKIEVFEQLFAKLKSRFSDHLASGDHQKLFNTYTLYTILWMNIATCGRARLTPAPVAIVNGCWALMTDKSRSDGSTDRVVPLTDAALAQLKAYFDFAWQLSITEPRLQILLRDFSDGTMKFQWYRKDGKLVDFRPVHIEKEFASLIQLPGNFARKLVRAEGISLPGRFLDAGMGHWVRGRHPWRMTSNMPSAKFACDWTLMQEQLEKRLGLQVLHHPNAQPGFITWPPTGLVRPAAKKTAPRPVSIERDFAHELEQCDRELFQLLEFQDAPEPLIAKELAIMYLTSQGLEDEDELAQLAGSVCEYMRKKWKVPIFPARPTAVLARDWMIDRVGLLNLAHFERTFLPAFQQDLERLPVVVESEQGRLIEYGRLIMIAVWRLGLHSKPAIDGFLKTIRHKPILATGDLRYLELLIPGANQRDATERTLILDDFSQAFLTAGKAHLCEFIDSFWDDRTQTRRNRWDRAVNAYVQSLGIQTVEFGVVGLMIGAANQQLMLQASPSLAAYTKGDYITHDLNDEELRRLTGLAPRSGYQSELLSGTANPVESQRQGDQSAGLLEKLPQGTDPVRDMVTCSSRTRSVMIKKCRDVKTETSAEKLIQAYALWLLDQDDLTKYETAPELRSKNKAKIPIRTKNQFAQRVMAVGYAILGFGALQEAWSRIDEELLDALFELSRDVLPSSNHRAAWYHFGVWLRSPECTAIELGFEIGNLGFNSDRNVSAKIIHPNSVAKVLERLLSAKSGIGNPAMRQAARNLVNLAQVYGTRRSEAEMLRQLDYQGDVLRLQPYDEKTLKTSWAERLLPLVFADEQTRRWIAGRDGKPDEQLIDEIGRYAHGYNFYDRLNKALQQLNGDANLRLHHFRHTLATRLALSMHSEVVDYRKIYEELPWLESLLMPRPEVEALLGNEGHAGHGLQAISALLGHSHPTTTLAHYCHSMGLIFYAFQQSNDIIDMSRSFENRLALSTVQRWVTEASNAVG